MKLKAYISGPITGRPELNLPAFREAEQIAKAMNLHPIVPHDLFDGVDPSGITWEQYMKTDLKVLLDCQMVITLEGWHESRGAMIEVDLARKLSIPVISIHKAMELSKEPAKIETVLDPQFEEVSPEKTFRHE